MDLDKLLPSKQQPSTSKSAAADAALMSPPPAPGTTSSSSSAATAFAKKKKRGSSRTNLEEAMKLKRQRLQTPPNPYPASYEMTDREDESSDYSNDDEPSKDRIPLWAQKPYLQRRLQEQENFNPDAIFGNISEVKLDLQDIFKGFRKKKRFTRREMGSGDWTPDRIGKNWQPSPLSRSRA